MVEDASVAPMVVISLKQEYDGQAKRAALLAVGSGATSLCLRYVIVVDDDVDVFDESDVLWAIATRAQADRDLVVINGSMGSMLDPSASEQGITAKLGIDATKPVGEPYAERLVMDTEKMAWARSLADQLEARRHPT